MQLHRFGLSPGRIRGLLEGEQGHVEHCRDEEPAREPCGTELRGIHTRCATKSAVRPPVLSDRDDGAYGCSDQPAADGKTCAKAEAAERSIPVSMCKMDDGAVQQHVGAEPDVKADHAVAPDAGPHQRPRGSVG